MLCIFFIRSFAMRFFSGKSGGPRRHFAVWIDSGIKYRAGIRRPVRFPVWKVDSQDFHCALSPPFAKIAPKINKQIAMGILSITYRSLRAQNKQ